MLLQHLGTAFVTLGAVALFFAITFRVGYLRGKYGIIPPSNDGPVDFLRARGVQGNTLEHLMIFLPSLWIFALAMSERFAVLLGVIWIAARAVYAFVYYRDPTKRLPHFMVALMASLALLIGGVVGLLAIANMAADTAG